MRSALTLVILLIISIPCFGQSYSGILAPGRVPPNGWNTRGLPATMPAGGGTTLNPWTSPSASWPICTTAQAGTTIPIASGATQATISAAVAACAAANPTGSVVTLACGTAASPATFTVATGTQIKLGDNGSGTSHNNVALRGACGAQYSKIVLAGTGVVDFANALGSGTGSWTAGFAQGATSLTMGALTSGSLFTAGQIIQLRMCNTGFSGSPCAGAVADNGGIFNCAASTSCAPQTTIFSNQTQVVEVTSISSGPPYTVNFTPALDMPNWNATGSGNTISWTSSGSIPSPSGIGLEDVTVDETAINPGSNFGIQFEFVRNSWMTGVRVVGAGAAEAVNFVSNSHCLIFNNYFDNYSYTRGDLSLSIDEGTDSSNLILNNIMLHGLSVENEGDSDGDLTAYNDAEQTHTLYYEDGPFNHVGGCSMILFEGNESGHLSDNNTFGTCNMNNFVRNYVSGWDAPYLLSPSCASLSCVGIEIDGYHRFDNVVGNALGSALVFNYEAIFSTPTNGITDNAAYRWSHAENDPLTLSSAFLWGNCDTGTNTCRFQASENPTTMTGNAAPLNNISSPSTSIPCSFFLTTGTSCTPLLTGGTGFSWYKVGTGCTFTATFSCTGSQIQPFPIAGPELTGGPYVNGHGYDNPAHVAFHTLPVDTLYQHSFSITGSSWSPTCSNQPSGTYACETLTVAGLPAGSAHIMGGFQITGATACNTAGAPGGSNEFLITSSSLSGTTGTITYALASNPGSGACNGGTMLFPDVKQFDERVYQADTIGGGSVSLNPSSQNFGLIPLSTSSGAASFVLSNTTGVSTTAINPSIVGGNTGDFSINNSGAGSCGAAGNTIVSGQSCTITVTFTPQALGSRSSTLSVSFTNTSFASPVTSSLSGTGIAINVAPAPQQFIGN